MINRREFVYSCGALVAAAHLPESPPVFYDLVLRGGQVIDPSMHLNGVRDVAVSHGRIVAVERHITGDAAAIINAHGKLVVPGLIDIHTHTTTTPQGPELVLQDGVTGWIDAGTQGADHIVDAIAIARSSPQQGRVLINIGRAGIIAEGDTMDLKRADVDAARAAIAKDRDYIVGIKARLSRDVAGVNDFEVLRRAQEAAAPFGLPVMIHMGQTISPLEKLFPLLKSGDIVTHMFAPPPNSLIDESGHIRLEVMAARRRGVWFDVGNGQNGHMRWDIVAAMMKAGFWPDTFSTDWNPNSRQTGVIDLPNCMSKLFGYGMSLDQAIARGTWKASRIFQVFRNRGTLNVGAPADIALLELRKGHFEFLDNFHNTVIGTQRLFPAGTVLAGKWIPRTEQG